jgi:adenylate kinase
MMIALSGTPGTGKSSVADELTRRGVNVIRAGDTVNDYRIGRDPDRDTDIIDDERWALEFKPVEGLIEGHLSHLLPTDQIIIFRCRPDILMERLKTRNYSKAKIRENVEAELLDVILIETLEIHGPEKIYEIDTTGQDISSLADQVIEVIKGTAKPVSGMIDWLECCGDLL